MGHQDGTEHKRNLVGKCLWMMKGWEPRKGVSLGPSAGTGKERDGQLQNLEGAVATRLPSFQTPVAGSEAPKTTLKFQ